MRASEENILSISLILTFSLVEEPMQYSYAF